jgi:hypothetical protein
MKHANRLAEHTDEDERLDPWARRGDARQPLSDVALRDDRDRRLLLNHGHRASLHSGRATRSAATNAKAPAIETE